MNSVLRTMFLMCLATHIFSYFDVLAATKSSGIAKTDSIPEKQAKETVANDTNQSDVTALKEELKKELRTELKNELIKEVKSSFKEGCFDAVRVLESSEEMKEGWKEIEKILNEKKQEVAAIEKRAMKEKAALEQMGGMLDEKAKEKRVEEFAKMEAEYQSKVRSAQAYAERAEQELRMKGLKKMQEIVNEIGENEGYSMIFAGGVVYSGKAHDLTERVIVSMNERYNNNRTHKIDTSKKDDAAMKMADAKKQLTEKSIQAPGSNNTTIS